MTAAPTSGPPPPWVALLDHAELGRVMGSGTLQRGVGYHESGKVTALVYGRDGQVVLATVSGSGSRTYQTLITVEEYSADRPERAGRLSWDSRCSCPMGGDCKHVVAAILTARDRIPGSNGPAASSWERAFAGLVDPATVAAPAATASAAVALHCDLHRTLAGRYGAGPGAALRVRPLVPGRNGGWIRSGVSWRDLEYGFGYGPAGRILPAHREALLNIMYAVRAAGGAGYYSSDEQLSATRVSPGLWRLLREAAEAGVPLVAGSKGHLPVVVAAEGARFDLDVTHAEAGAQLTPRLRLPAVAGGVPTGVGPGQAAPELVGTPPTGVAVHTEHAWVLAPFDPPLDPALVDLVTATEPLRIPDAELPRFLADYYPTLRQRIRLESSDASVSLPDIEPPRVALFVGHEPHHQTLLRWSFSYRVGDTTTTVPITVAPGRGARDLAAEAALLADLVGLEVLDRLPGLCVEVGGQPTLVPEQRLSGLQTAVFVAEILPALADHDDLELTVEGSPLDYQEVDEAPLISVSVNDPDDGGAAQQDWFDLGVSVTVAGEQVPFTPLFAALARGDEHLLMDSGTWFALDRAELHTLRRLIEEARSLQDRESAGLRVTRWHAGLWEELVNLGVVDHQSERWTRSVGALLDLAAMPTPPAPVGLTGELRDYQLQGYHWLSLLWDHQLGGVLADDMGLGKTLQTLAMAARAQENGTLTPQAPLLIVTPTSVVATWQREAARFCPELRVATITETRRRAGQSMLESTAGAHLVVTSFALLRIDEAAFLEHSFSGLVLDEAQFVKNHQAKTYQVARRLPAPFKLAITGTPLENSLMDLWALLSIVAPGLFPNPQRFTELYRRPIESGRAPELLASLRTRIRPVMLRRTKEQVASDLPPKIEQVMDVTLNPQHQRHYQRHLQRERQRVLGMLDDVNRNRIAILRSLTILRQLSLDVSLVDPELAGSVRSSKIDALVEHLGEVAAEGHRALVFSQFTRFLSLVRERLTAEGIDHVYLDGRTRNRPARIAEFTDGTAPAFVISLKAGGSGLTLTEADYVYVLDPWWNPATEAQAIDRTHRIGQDKTVMVYRLIAAGTIEEKVVELQQRKRDLFARVVDEGALMGGALTAEDIRGLLD